MECDILCRYKGLLFEVIWYSGKDFKEKFNAYLSVKYKRDGFKGEVSEDYRREIINRSVSDMCRYAFDQTIHITDNLDISPHIINPNMSEYIYRMVLIIDRYKSKHEMYTPERLYGDLDRVKFIPEEYSILLKNFRSKNKKNILRIYLTVIMDIKDDFGFDVTRDDIIYRLAYRKSLIEIQHKSYFNLFIEVQSISNV